MLLAFDTSTSACTAALFDETGACLDSRDELIGRGHAERLVPMIADLLRDKVPNRILVGVGPGSFTGIRVAIAAAQGLAIGWNAEIAGMSSIGLLAAGIDADGPVAVALAGGHGELFVQQFDPIAQPNGEIANMTPASAATSIASPKVFGSGARQLVDARGSGEAFELWPSARNSLKIPEALRSLSPRPFYGRAPDAKATKAA